MALKTKWNKKVRNLIELKLEYAVRRACTDLRLKAENNQNKNSRRMKNVYTKISTYTCFILCVRISRQIRVFTCS